MIIIFDFETFFGPKYSLTTLSYTDYIDHPSFKVHGCAIKEERFPPFWLEPDQFPTYVQSHLHDTFVAHNAPFDLTIWTRYYKLPLPARLVCTKALAALTRGYTEPDLSLATLTGEKGEDLKLTYGLRELPPLIKVKLMNYALNDVVITEKLLHGLLSETVAAGIDLKQELRAIDATLRLLAPKIPLCVDREKLRVEEVNERQQEQLAVTDAAKQLGLSLKELEKQVKSRPKFTELLTRLGVEVPTKKSPSTGEQIPAIAKNDEAFTKLREQYDGTIVAELIDLRLNLSSSLKRTRTARLQRLALTDDPIAPIQVHLNFAGAQQTLRWSGANSLNLQNLPREGSLRACLVPPEGHKLVVCDYSSIEARVLAWLAKEEDTLKVFRAGHDVYVDMAEKVWPGTARMDKEDKEFKRRRFASKCLILGLGYQAGWVVLESILRLGVLSGGKTRVTFSEQDALEMGVSGSEFADFFEWYLSKIPEDRGQALTRAVEENPVLFWHYATCQFLVKKYRADHPMTKALWERFSYPEDGVFGGLRYGWEGKDWAVHLPGGTRLLYNTPVVEERGWSYWLKKGKVYTHGGRAVENFSQSVARNLLRDAWVEANQVGLNVVLTVHDEIVCVQREDEAGDARDVLTRIMSTAPAWASDLPVEAEAKICNSYAEK